MKYRGSPLSKQHKVRYQSTLVLLNSEGKIGRIVAHTDQAIIKGLLDKAM